MDIIESGRDDAEEQLRDLLDAGLADLREKRYRPAEDVFFDIERKFGLTEIAYRSNDKD